DLNQFRRWYSQAGTPVVTVRGRYDAATRTYVLDMEQKTAATPGQSHKQPFHIPFAVGLLDHDGRELPLRFAGESGRGAATRVLNVTKARESFRFVDIPAPPIPSLLRGFSAPVKVVYDYNEDDLAFLAAHDSDPVNRWDAAQRLMTGVLLRLSHDHRGARRGAVPALLTSLVGGWLRDEAGDPAWIAVALTLPDPCYVAALEPVIDVDGVKAAHILLQREIGRLQRSALA